MLFSRDVAPSQSRIGRCGSCRAGARRHIAERRLVLGSRIPAATQGGCNGGGGGCHGGRQPSRFGGNRRRTAPPGAGRKRGGVGKGGAGRGCLGGCRNHKKKKKVNTQNPNDIKLDYT